jgi:hypothetical protein
MKRRLKNERKLWNHLFLCTIENRGGSGGREWGMSWRKFLKKSEGRE